MEITVSQEGRLPQNGERLVNAFGTLSPDADAVVAQNTLTEELAATFFVQASDPTEAVERGAELFAAAAAKAGLAVTPVVGVQADLLRDQTPDPSPQLSPVGA